MAKYKQLKKTEKPDTLNLTLKKSIETLEAGRSMGWNRLVEATESTLGILKEALEKLEDK